jgi:hypothetical protein
MGKRTILSDIIHYANRASRPETKEQVRYACLAASADWLEDAKK